MDAGLQLFALLFLIVLIASVCTALLHLICKYLIERHGPHREYEELGARL